MGISSLSQAVFLSGLAIALGSLPGAAIDLSQQSFWKGAAQHQPEWRQLAQAGEITCRQTNNVTAVYQQPDPVSVSQGVLSAGQTVRLEVVGTGTGWSRIREPIVGWVEARYLTPPTPCTAVIATQTNRSTSASSAPINPAPINPAPINPAPINPTPVAQANPAPLPQGNATPIASRAPINNATPGSASNFPQPIPSGRSQVTVPPLSAVAPQPDPQPLPQSYPQPQPVFPQNSRSNPVAVAPTVPPLPAILPQQTAPTGRAIVTATCDVLPREGLVVRRQPDLTSAGSSVLAPGTYNFQFTGATQTVGRQRLAYIVSPAEGWIWVGTLDGASTLGGGRCG